MRLLMLAEALDVPIAYFFDRLVTGPKSSEMRSGTELTDRDIELIRQLRELPHDAREAIENVVSSAMRSHLRETLPPILEVASKP